MLHFILMIISWVNKLSAIRALASVPNFKFSSGAISLHANSFLMYVFEVNQIFIVQNWIAPDKLCQPLILHFYGPRVLF